LFDNIPCHDDDDAMRGSCYCRRRDVLTVYLRLSPLPAWSI
jgi:hypothetical protein